MKGFASFLGRILLIIVSMFTAIIPTIGIRKLLGFTDSESTKTIYAVSAAAIFIILIIIKSLILNKIKEKKEDPPLQG